MEFWHAWTGLLQTLLHMLAVDWGLGAGLAVIALTLAVRAALMPLTWSLACRSIARQAKISSLEPQLRAIRERHPDDPRAQMLETVELYRRHGLNVADGKGMLGSLVQLPVIYGLYQALRGGMSSAAFLWIRDLARPRRSSWRWRRRCPGSCAWLSFCFPPCSASRPRCICHRESRSTG